MLASETDLMGNVNMNRKIFNKNPTAEKRTRQKNKRNNKVAIHQSAPWKNRKETKTPNRDRQCSNKYMQRRI